MYLAILVVMNLLRYLISYLFAISYPLIFILYVGVGIGMMWIVREGWEGVGIRWGV